jgi:ethanolamine utilization microcompartment shell protein EutS
MSHKIKILAHLTGEPRRDLAVAKLGTQKPLACHGILTRCTEPMVLDPT